ncbi:hypothetical protein GQR86_02440 [Providencia vermicola]|nr:hypothetical protein [Providencia sp. G1(2023)]MBC8652428.1 hypothetical protein [Providencia vermicola]
MALLFKSKNKVFNNSVSYFLTPANLYLGGNDTPGENGYKIHVPAGGTNSVTLKAVLGTNGRVQAGQFEGAAALILTVP